MKEQNGFTRITEQTIRRMKPPEKDSYIQWAPRSQAQGFGVRVTAQGVVSFVLDYRIFGRHRRYTIGSPPDCSLVAALDEAAELRAKIRKGIDPMEERHHHRTEPSMNDLIAAYRASQGFQRLSTHTRKDYERKIDKIISLKLKSLRLKAIGKRDIEALHASLNATPYQANRVLALLSKMFNFAMEEKWIIENPARGVKKFHEERRENWLSVEQIAKFQQALDEYKDQSAANCLRLLLLTGSRSGETLKAEWKEFDLTRGVWSKPSHHTKQKKTEHVPLSAPAIDLLKSMRPNNASGPLFAGRVDGHRVSLKRPWLQACKAAGLVEVEEVKGKRRHKVLRYRPTVRLHDLRHSFASHLVSSGVGLQIVGKLLGHVQASTTQRYAHLADEALRTATNKLAEIIEFKKGC